jgi:hypothetical protein
MMTILAHDSLIGGVRVDYRKLKYALSHDRIYRFQSHDIVLKSHAFSGNSIESSIANLVFDFDNALKFQSHRYVYERNLCLHRIWTSIRLFLVRTRDLRIGSILSTGGEAPISSRTMAMVYRISY